ncbi:protein ARV1 isoform X2 [Danaus plexippus]|uniref:protein ARV1 isoform X2 n=1 Tax=Danaus plexippus TaxID=13037 RepID=UPI002AB03A67|nr:protein ARV1 isoform X2 [Danaus plexippus]
MENRYKCVNCGAAAGALYRTYGPSVLKLTKCDTCKGLVDKYIEYDSVIVMIDLVLMSKAAQRHIIYNTDFKIYWKLFIILMMLETYGVWKNDSLFNIVVTTVCDIRNKYTLNTTHILPIDFSLPESYQSKCRGWEIEDRDAVDLFIWEKNFYIQFISTFIGIVIFIVSVHVTMSILRKSNYEVSIKRIIQCFSLSQTSLLLTLPMLVWGHTDTPHTRLLHYTLVFGYSLVLYYNVFYVLYQGPKIFIVVALLMSNCLKYLATFHATPMIRQLLK